MLVRPTKNYLPKSKSFLLYFSTKYRLIKSEGNMCLLSVEGYKVMFNIDYSLMFLEIYEHDHPNILNIVQGFESEIKKVIKGFKYDLPDDLLKMSDMENRELGIA